MIAETLPPGALGSGVNGRIRTAFPGPYVPREEVRTVTTRRALISLPRLRWIAIGLPLAFVLAIGLAHDVLLEPHVDRSVTDLLTGLMTATGVVVFSVAIFRVLERKERIILMQARRAEALHQIGAELSALLDTDSLIRLIVARAHELLAVDAAGLARLDDDGGMLYWDHFVTSGSQGERVMAIHLQPGEGIVGRVIATGRPLIIVDTARMPPGIARAPLLDRDGLRSAAVVPLRVGERTLGALLVANQEPTVFGDDAVALLTSLANHATLALANAELLAKAQLAAERLEQLIESSGDAIITADRTGRITSWNRGAEQIYGWSRAEAIGSLLPMVPPDRRDEAAELLQNVSESGAVVANFETVRLREDGRRIDVVVTASPIHGPGNSVIGTLGISKDMSAHRQVVEQQQRLALLEDRERIGMELHDGVIQSLYALGLGLESVLQVVALDPPLAAHRVEQARDGAHALIQEIRNYIFGLRPETSLADGLVAGMTALARELGINALIDVELDIAEAADRAFDAARAEQLFQIVREALRNVARHARASRAVLSLRPVDDAWLLRIWDNGTGFRVADTWSAGFGLGNMRARARRVGSDLVIDSETGKGTEITLILPPDEEVATNGAEHSAAHSHR